MTNSHHREKRNTGRLQLDFHSLKFRLFCMFMLFTLVLIALVWFLQIFFLNHYYEEMKARESREIAREIKLEFAASGYSLDELFNTINEKSAGNDLTIIISDQNGDYMTNVTSEGFMGLNSYQRYSTDIATLNGRLAQSRLGSVTILRQDSGKNRILEYASYIGEKSEYTMYLFSPLYPVGSTVAILRSQLFYISIISIILALILALYLSTIIARPIRRITGSAAEMGKGNYDVQFKGGGYSEITELADTLTIAERELKKTDEYHKDLIANVSHDLKTPLTMIKSYAEMIRDLSGDNPVKRNAHLQTIIEEADRLNNLVNDMLNLSRMQSRRIDLELSTFDLLEATEQMLHAYDILEENEDYHFTLEHDRDVYMVTADRQRIIQVMNNLVSNAVKYCGEDKVIMISLYRAGKNVRFEVTDHGQGIAEDEITHVWERYYKSSTHHVRSTTGTGLGLSIVKEVLKLHNAPFGVDSQIGAGSTFWFELPLSKTRKNS